MEKSRAPKNYKCAHCGRIFTDRPMHSCNGNVRSKNLAFIDRNNILWKQETKWVQSGHKDWKDV